MDYNVNKSIIYKAVELTFNRILEEEINKATENVKIRIMAEMPKLECGIIEKVLNPMRMSPEIELNVVLTFKEKSHDSKESI
jgi:hypothetical protein